MRWVNDSQLLGCRPPARVVGGFDAVVVTEWGLWSRGFTMGDATLDA